MSMLRGLIAGTLALTTTDLLTSSATNANNAAGITAFFAKAFRQVVDVDLPLIPNIANYQPH